MDRKAQVRRERYLYRKYKLCKALISEKEATIKRLEAEIDALHVRKERLGSNWAKARREINAND
jgi:hypothetical protein